MEDLPRVDLVVATVGRFTELKRLLKSLVVQAYPKLRVVLVDQNSDERLVDVVSVFQGQLSLVHLKAPLGLSRARNLALPQLTGEIVGFPDDDCWYPPGLLRDVVGRLVAHPEWGGLSVQARDARGRRSSMLWDRKSGPIDRYNIWRRAISFTFFVRRPVVSAVGDFAEDLGLGAGTRWGSGEESDYLLRALTAGFSIQYEPSLFVHHESPRLSGDKAERRDAYLRGLGHGEVLRRSRYPLWFAAFRTVQLLVGSTMMVARGRVTDARYYFAMALGRAKGWLGSDRE